jgi:integrase
MTTHNANNERTKRQYFAYLKEARRYSEETVDAVAKSLTRFESATNYRDFKAFRCEQAVAFKRHLAQQDGVVSGTKLSKATLHATLNHLKRFFQWVAMQPGFKSRVRFSDAEYFNLSDNESRVATARRERRFPTIEQVRHVISLMPSGDEIAKRDRAVVAFILLTGARDSAVASLKCKHVDVQAGSVYQDAREVKTKFGKTFLTYFFPVGDEVRAIVVKWVTYLREIRLWGNDDPLFPATKVGLDDAGQFHAAGVGREHWGTAEPIRVIFRHAFSAADLPYFNPHSLRNTLVQLGETVCRTPEDFKAWSQNLGHEGVLTTFLSYGAVGSMRQGQILRELGTDSRPRFVASAQLDDAVRRVLREARRPRSETCSQQE